MIEIAHAAVLYDVNSVTATFTNLGNTFIQILIAFAVIWIIYNVVRYLIFGGDKKEDRETARSAIIWGVIGLAIILSIWGLVNLLTNTFRFYNNSAPVQNYPYVPSRTGGTINYSSSYSGGGYSGAYYGGGYSGTTNTNRSFKPPLPPIPGL